MCKLSEHMQSSSADRCVDGERRVWFWRYSGEAGLFTYFCDCGSTHSRRKSTYSICLSVTEHTFHILM